MIFKMAHKSAIVKAFETPKMIKTSPFRIKMINNYFLKEILLIIKLY